MCLAQGHNAVMPVREEPATPRSRVKHSTTEPEREIVYIHYFLIHQFSPVLGALTVELSH